MAYTDTGTNTHIRTRAIMLVAGAHVLIGAAFVTGLAQKITARIVERPIEVTYVDPATPNTLPPEKTEAQQRQQAAQSLTPPPLVQRPAANDEPLVLTPLPLPELSGGGSGGEVLDTPSIEPLAATVTPVAARPLASPQSWVSNIDYPAQAVREGLTGATAVRVGISVDGRPVSCDVTSSSGYAVLDDSACRLILKRARFAPASDAYGKAVAGSFSTRFVWNLSAD